ncbi:MAG: hypothetical protein IJF92_04010 [Bacilli bacterium]|nr:hypothetical protein [Bacilli bacterium]
MRDAIGGSVNMFFVAVFIAVVSGYLAFSVNYTKAFRMKNKIITTFEQYKGCEGTTNQSSCNTEIEAYRNNIGYNSDISCESGWTRGSCYCYKKVLTATKDANHSYDEAYYKVKTNIVIDIPVINKIMPHIKALDVSGNTKIIVLR